MGFSAGNVGRAPKGINVGESRRGGTWTPRYQLSKLMRMKHAAGKRMRQSNPNADINVRSAKSGRLA